jgi:hypothetical protein
MEASGPVLVAVLSAGALMVACVVAAMFSIRRLQFCHPVVWDEMGRPYGPFGFSGARYLKWLQKCYYTQTGDSALIAACRFQRIAPIAALVLGLGAIVAGGAWKAAN